MLYSCIVQSSLVSGGQQGSALYPSIPQYNQLSQTSSTLMIQECVDAHSFVGLSISLSVRSRTIMSFKLG